ncbi:shikimate kinase, partial [Bifidobacterium catenulatum]
MRRPVAVIIGMMGAGKTRVGKEVAQMMNLPFADADNEIEYDAGMRIPEYFEKYGESEFRKLESDVVLDMLEDFDGIFSLGGGAPMTPSIQEGLARYVASGGKVVYLMADPEEAMERANRGGGRPMLNGDANMRWKKLYKERDPVFRRVANVHVGTRGQSPQAAARKLMEMIDQRIVHVTGSTIEPYDVHIGEGVMGQLAQILGSKPVKVALIHTQPVQR